jgi:hypothetical protein
MVFVSVKDGSTSRTSTLTEPQEPMQREQHDVVELMRGIRMQSVIDTVRVSNSI